MKSVHIFPFFRRYLSMESNYRSAQTPSDKIAHSYLHYPSTIIPLINQLLLALWCLTPLSTIFQLYRGGTVIRNSGAIDM